MPLFSLTDWRNSGEMKPEDLKGKIVVIDFWATWCVTCLDAVPHNKAIAAKYKDKGVVLLGVCTSAGQERYDEIIERFMITYPTARDASMSMEQAWRVMWYPTVTILDRKGNVRAAGLSADGMDKVIEKLLAEGA
jgi:thiol-disulfide isomerase/thioredoxin